MANSVGTFRNSIVDDEDQIVVTCQLDAMFFGGYFGPVVARVGTDAKQVFDRAIEAAEAGECQKLYDTWREFGALQKKLRPFPVVPTTIPVLPPSLFVRTLFGSGDVEGAKKILDCFVQRGHGQLMENINEELFGGEGSSRM